MSDDFEDGSIAAANVIFAWIGRTYGATHQASAVRAWDAGEMFPAAVAARQGPPSARVGGPGHVAAFAQGYTGESCDHCGSMRMKRTGTCLTCEDCGTTTGCA